MGMVIRNNIDSVRAYNIYNKNTMALSDTMYKVSSGQRINSAIDGPSDLAISERMRGRIRSNDQAARNVQQDTNLIKTAEGALSNIVDLLNTVRERIINAANDTNTSAERNLISSEIIALVDQIDENSKVTYNGIKLLGGQFGSEAGIGSGLNFQIGGDQGLNMNIHIEAMSSSGLGIANVGGATAIDVSSASAAMVSLGKIDSAINSVLAQRTALGSIEARLGFVADNLATETENLTASESAIRDLDMAKGMTDFMKFNVLTQASQFMLAQAGQNAYSVLNLLQQ
jgi:flagellin